MKVKKLMLEWKDVGTRIPLDDDPLSGEGSRADEIEKYYGAEGSTDHLEDDPMEGKEVEQMKLKAITVVKVRLTT
jgi:hypothetical protein